MPITSSSPPPDAGPGHDPRPLILTALLEPETQARFAALRQAHFPPERNYIPAHLTLFHHLPGSEREPVLRRVKALAATTAPLAATVASLQFTGRGVSYRLHAPGLDVLRAELAEGWATLLIPQDRQGFRPHVTVQNKVEASVARATHAALSAGFAPWPTGIVALALWRYLGGPWEALATVRLRGRER